MDQTTIPEDMDVILQTAIQMEEKGYKYYSESAKRIKNSLGKRLLERLANDEKNHIQRFTEMFNALTNSSIDEVKIDKVPATTFDEIFNRMKDQLEDALEEMQEVGVDDAEILEMALDLESHAKFFYAEAAKKATEAKIKEFLDLLAIEEQAHYDVLRKSLDFLDDPSLFFGMGVNR